MLMKGRRLPRSLQGGCHGACMCLQGAEWAAAISTLASCCCPALSCSDQSLLLYKVFQLALSNVRWFWFIIIPQGSVAVQGVPAGADRAAAPARHRDGGEAERAGKPSLAACCYWCPSLVGWTACCAPCMALRLKRGCGARMASEPGWAAAAGHLLATCMPSLHAAARLRQSIAG